QRTRRRRAPRARLREPAARRPRRKEAVLMASTLLRAYGDREGDGMIQLSFTLAILPGDRAREAAKRFAEAHGIKHPLVVTMEQASAEHTYFVVYGKSVHAVDIDAIHVEELGAKALTRDEIEQAAKKLGRKIVVVGACTGS